MFMPRVFVEKNRNKQLELIENNSLGTLVVSSAGEYDVNHLPFVIDSHDAEKIRLRAHLPKANPLCSKVNGKEKCVGNASMALAINLLIPMRFATLVMKTKDSNAK